MNELLYQFDLDKKYIEEYPLETTEGTKKMIKTYHINAINSRNAYVNNKIEMYEEIKQDILNHIKGRVETLTPQDTSSNYININNLIDNYKNIIRLNSEYNTIYEKLGFDKIINDIGDIDLSDLSQVNSLINDTLNIYTKASISLSVEDFDYSMYTKEYMGVYLSNIGNEAFNDIMKAKFDEFYWECPNIITHIKLSLRNLFNKYKKQLEVYYQNMINEMYVSNNTNKESYLNNFISFNKQLDEYRNKDTYLLSYNFLNGNASIYEYEYDTPQFRKNFNRFLFEEDFKNLEEKDQINFYNEMKSLKFVVTELKGYNLYKDYIKDVIARYKDKESYKNLYSEKQKEIEKEEKIRQDLYKDYYKKETKFLFFGKKVNKEMIKVQINEQIKKLDNLYTELDNALVNDTIMNKLSDTSNIYDALTLISSYYSYFKTLYSKINKDASEVDYLKEFNDLFDYINNVDNTFIKKIKFIDETDINDIIFEKYKLLNINISKDDLTDNLQSLENSIDYVNLFNNINNSNISIDVIRFIIDSKKIEKN